MNRTPNPSELPGNNEEHEQRIAAIRERAQRHAQRSARLFTPPPEEEGSDLPVPSLLAVACSVALANQAQAQAIQVSNETQLGNAIGGGAVNIELTQDISLGNTHFGNGFSIDGKDHTLTLNGHRFLGGPLQSVGNISNITFKDGNHSGIGSNGGVLDMPNGGVITGNITDSKFINNKSGNTGGAIYTQAGIKGNIEGSLFQDNEADSAGGAIHTASDINSIKDSRFINNKSSNGGHFLRKGGGAVSIAGSLREDIVGSHFEGNISYGSGGGMIVNDIQGTIRESHFVNNTSTNSHGGALYIFNDLEGGIEDSTFSGNTAKLNGGAIDIKTLTGGIRNTEFTNNYSETGTGGALWVHGTGGVAILNGISGSTFKENSAGGTIGGGAVSVNGKIENGIKGSTFENNKVLDGAGIGLKGGGAIYANTINGGISSNSLFKGNTAKTGGAIFLIHSGGTVGTLNGGIDNSKFIGNTTTYSGGGAIHLNNGILQGGIKNGTEFRNNTAQSHGGALWLINLKDGISDSIFSENKALTGIGGAINTDTIDGGITSSIFEKNTTEAYGGAIAAHSSIKGNISNTTFDNNKTDKTGSGGAVWVGGTGTFDGSIIDSTFTNNSSGDGGALRTYIFTGDINNTKFIGNTSYNLGGGAIHSNQIYGGIKNGSVFENNVSHGTYGGGAIWTDTINDGISDSTFTGNEALASGAKGGAINAQISIDGGITDSTFKKNSAGEYGGAIAVGDQTKGSFSGGITRSHFEENQAVNVGGAMRAYVYQGGIHDSKFIKNTSGLRGGALDSATWINGGITSNSLFSGNTADSHGGAIYAVSGINGGISDTTFENNTSTTANGGAISTGGSGTISGDVTNSVFSKNTAGNVGGAISAHTLTGNIVDSEFSGNIAGEHAGAIWAYDGINGNISGTTFADNKAQSSGGAIATWGNGAINGNITNSIFSNNTAVTRSGGAIWAGSVTGVISDSTFSGNTAEVFGGALYLNDTSASNTIVNSTFSNNIANDMGGAIFQVTGGTLNVSDSRFLGNIAQFSGGAIKSDNLSIRNSAFIGNQGVDNSGINNSATGLGTGLGGAILIQGQLDIENSVFLGNSSAYRGAAIHHHHDAGGTTQNIRIAGGADKTLFYGNQETDSGRYSSIEFSHTRDNLGDVTIHADSGAEGNSGVLMLDAMQSVNNPAISYAAGSVLNIKKTGDGDWFLGGDNRMIHPGAWNINQGRLALTDVDYDGSGAEQAQINLRDGGFTLNNGAVLEGRGTISASEINLKGTINPNLWHNTGMLATAISTGVTQADIDSIQTVTDKDAFATITLDTQGSGNAVKMDGAIYEVGVAWADDGAGGFTAESDLLDVKGKLEVTNNSGINITRLDFDQDWALARIQGGGSEPAAQIIKTADGISGDFKVQVAGTLAPSSDFLKVRGEQVGNDYEVKLGLAWYSKERDGSKTATSGNSVLDAHGGFTVDAGGSFTIGGALEKRTDIPNFSNETTEVGGPAGWDGNSLTKRGDGTLILNADNTYDGVTTIDGGKLVLGDSAANAGARVGGDVQINNGGIFDGYGTAKGDVIVENGAQFTGFGGADGLLHVKNGGLLAPGNATEMGTVGAGRLQIDAGGTYRVKTDANGGSDLVNVVNDATIHGGTVDVRAKDGNWGVRGTQHTRTIIQTGGTLTGAFDDVTTDLAFLTPNLDYNSNQVILGLTRNSTKMEDIADGSTRNRMNTGGGLGGLEASGANPTLINELLGLNKDDALRAFDSLSGEIYPTTSAVLLQSSRQLRTRINTRLTVNTQGTGDAPSFNAIRALGVSDTGTSTPVWVSAWGHTGNQGRTPNAARAEISGNGVLVGMDNTDRPMAGGLHAGMMFGAESTKVDIADDRNSRSEVDSRSAGVYGGSAIGDDTQWRGGLIYSDLDIETQRTVTVNNLTERVSAERKGKQMQAFAEISHNLTLSNRTSVAPWLSVAKVWQRLDPTSEGTGATALEIDKQSATATLTSVGGRGQMNLGGGRIPVALYADVGYQHVVDSKNNDSKHHFAGQTQDFAVRGTTLNDTLVSGVGVQLGVSNNSALLIEYRGEFGSGQKQHVGNISWQVKF